MKQRLVATRRGVVGVAISETGMYTVLPSPSSDGRSGGREREWSLTPLARTDADWPSLTDALAELRKLHPASHSALAVALLPPLAQVRRVELPRLKEDEARLILSRSAARYIPGVREPYTANGVALARSSPAPYIMVAAATRLVDAVTRAVRDSGWTLATIVSSYDAWTVAALQEWSALRSAGGDVAVPWNSHLELLQVHGGRVTGVRRVLREDAAAARSPSAVNYTLDHPMYAAAAAAPNTAGIELLPERIYAERAATRRRLKIRLGVAVAAVALLAAAGVLIRARYLLSHVVDQRTALAGQARQAAAAQGTQSTITGPLAALGRIETNAVLWSQILADLNDVLPADASLSSFRGHGDSLSIAGTAARGAEVFERLDAAKLIDNVRPSGPIRREIRDNGSSNATALDRFQLVSRIPGAAPLYAAKQPKGEKRP